MKKFLQTASIMSALRPKLTDTKKQKNLCILKVNITAKMCIASLMPRTIFCGILRRKTEKI